MDNGERFIRIEVPSSARGTVLSEWLAQSGHPVALPCGGRGVCGNCTVLLADGRRVPACRTEVPEEGLTVLLPPPARSPGGSDLPEPESIAAYALDIGTTTLELAAVDGNDLRTTLFMGVSCIYHSPLSCSYNRKFHIISIPCSQIRFPDPISL